MSQNGIANPRPMLKLWCSTSAGAEKLYGDLSTFGYEVKRIYSGSDKPIAAFRGDYVHGISDIRAEFLGRDIRLASR